ncbi:lebercilin isoform X1 [Electrophorus electricus]|uniref:lebercilin isoform X1 n=1 Tax=Electrophorus electricus TaxID=8005 RepID=UPI0015D0112A|nr:lebercilin isoform X1 [Electrophorus electricus]XP_026865185.2 lebercilin isoform X1 [Electrophorus electricus]XP_026865186.2 lebercilin isoform X1 [Electrophorus electricus]
MDSQNTLDSSENNQAKRVEQRQRSRHSHRKNTDSPLHSEKQEEEFHDDSESLPVDRAQTRTGEPSLDTDQGRERLSDGEQSSASFYSDNYENVSLSQRSLSPRSLSPSPRRGERPRRVASSPLQRPGVHKGASRRPGPQAPPHYPHPCGLRAQSLGRDATPKGVNAPAKGVDAVTKRVLSARVLRISELRNALAELRLHADTLQRENHLLRQLQLRQERALQRHGDAEGEVAELLARHANETRSLRERLRRGRERERMAESGRRESDARLQRCRDRLHKLQRLVNDQHLGEREELARQLSLMQSRAQESERRVKELEKNMELSNGSFQRQLASERRRTHDALQEVQALHEEVERLGVKLKEREKELDVWNIYANRMSRRVPKKESESPTKRKDSSGSSSKAVQTEERMLSLELPPPPPAMTNCAESSPDGQANEYLSLKQQLQSSAQTQKVTEGRRSLEIKREREKEEVQEREMENTSDWERERSGERERPKQMQKEVEKLKEEYREDDLRIVQEFKSNEERGTRERNGWGRAEEDRKRWHQSQKEEEKKKFHKQGEEEKWMREPELQANQEEERQRKEMLLAKMHEIDMQTQGHNSDFLSDEAGSIHSPPQFSVSQNQKNGSIFTFTEPHEGLSMSGGGKRDGGLMTQRTNEDIHLAFGSYTPSFGKPNPREVLGPRNPSHASGQLPGEEDSRPDLSSLVKERKSNLMQQLFGSTAAFPPPDPTGKMELLSSPSEARPLAAAPNGRRRDTETPQRLKSSDLSTSRNTLHVSEGRLAVRAITTFDDDIEEVTL